MEEVYKGNIFRFCKYVAKEITNKPSVSHEMGGRLAWPIVFCGTQLKKNGNHQFKMIFYKRLKELFGKNYILLIIFKLYSSFFLLFCRHKRV